ncbi:MAG TPA: SRPBCC family protein [Rhizomicrobium sp.]|nr:SRPBCC family protein [Rhizomicrobium sp.]
MNHRLIGSGRRMSLRDHCINIVLGLMCALPLLHDSDAAAASLSRSVNVNATASQVWSVIGPFCAIRDWHPVVGTCSQDAANPPTRTLVTKDGTVTFVEPQIARNESERFYTYTFRSSPFPVTHYMGTIWVVPNADNTSTVLWTGTYTPLAGKEQEAEADFAGVFDAGLAALKTRFSH